MVSKLTTAPVAMRSIPNISEAIESISYIENDELLSKYEFQRQLFVNQGKVSEDGRVHEFLLFHGTAISSLDSILSNNFKVDALPTQKNTSHETRKKAMKFGSGIYFSEIPSISLMYGNGLLLCKVMLGSCEVFNPEKSSLHQIPEEYDSREVQAQDKQGVIHIVKNPSQILPYCVIELRKQSLSSQYIKVNNTKSKYASTTNTSNSSLSTSNSSMPPVLSSTNWTIVKPRSFPTTITNKTYKAAEMVSLYSIDTDKCEEGEVCSICLEKLNLSCFLFLSQCKHKFHRDCLVKIVEFQCNQNYIQCSNCKLIYGEKTGNMPANSQMSWIKQSGMSLSGYNTFGIIVIKYNICNGVQTCIHPNPGKPYYAKGFPRLAFLPDNEKGNIVLQMMVTLFQRGLTFTIGRSITTGVEDCVIWNGIHHKTQINDNGSGYGYPDASYLDRVIEEHKQFGIYFSDFQ